jgi:hypothetical protein
MPEENDITQNHQENLEEFYALYEYILQAYENAKAEALDLFEQLRQEILATISDTTSQNLVELDQKISEIAAAYEEAKYQTISQVTAQTQTISTLHEAARINSENIYRTANNTVTKAHRDAVTEFKANAERVKNLINERKSDSQRGITELFNQFSETINSIHEAYLSEIEQQKLTYQIALAKYQVSGISILFSEVTTRKYLEARRRAKRGEEEEEEEDD